MEARKADHTRAASKQGDARQKMRFIATIVLIVVVSFSAFTFLYGRYNDRILYAERLNQMQDVTTQLFAGLEDVVGNQWSAVDVLANYVQAAQPEDTEALRAFMRQQMELNELDAELDDLIAVDERGRYYTADGGKGTLQELDYLLDSPARISYVSNTVTTNRTKMVFLKRLPQPVKLTEGREVVYYGCTRDMSELEPYFNCAAYESGSDIYVVDSTGLKLFSGRNSDLIHGYNLYNVLEEMDYRHGTSFDAARAELEGSGTAYSNAILDGKEYFYSMYRMENAEWTLVFMVDATMVAMNTVELVNTTLWVVMIFAILMIVICAVIIFLMQRRQQKRELAMVKRSNEALEKLNTELQSASKAKSEFLANMSHDIRTPMNAIVGITDLMAHEADTSDKLHTYIEKVRMSSRHLLSLINDVLDMSKIESSEVALNQDTVSLAEQVGQVDSIIRSQTNERGQTFNIRVHTIVHEYLIGDSVRLRQVLLNLLSNAVKYTPNGGTINFDLAEVPCEEPDCASFRITVEDNGCGMEPEFLARIFEPFTRSESSMTSKIQGTGLGMAITKNIVDLMGGTITVQSEPGKGSRFEVALTLPIDRSAEPRLSAKRILLVSDDSVLSRNIRASLKEYPISIVTAAAVAEAEKQLQEQPADLILVNGHLNDPDLAQIVQRLRASAQHAVLLFCCDYAQSEQVHDMLVKSGADDLIARPFFLSNLSRTVNRVQGNVAAAEPRTTTLKGMRFLCAEDNELNAEILEAILEVNKASCVIYPNGRELVNAFASVKPGEFDAILMDIQMPVMNGLDATRAIRGGKNPLGKTIPIVAMTANAFTEDIQQCLEAGMDAHVAKPLDVTVLERTMRGILDGNFAGGGTLVRLKRTQTD